MRKYPWPILDWISKLSIQSLEFSKADGTPIRVDRRSEFALCGDCHSYAIQQGATKITHQVLCEENGSIEKAVVRIVSEGIWFDDPSRCREPVGKRILVELLGEQPAWLTDDDSSTVALLHSEICKQRGLKPPNMTVLNVESRKVKNWLGKDRTEEFTTQLATLQVWLLTYSHEYGNMVMLVSVHGSVVTGLYGDWMPTGGIVKNFGNLEYNRTIALRIQEQLKDAKYLYMNSEAMSALSGRMREIVGLKQLGSR